MALDALKLWALERLKEPSTYIGLALVGRYLGFEITPEQAQVSTELLFALLGVDYIFKKR